MAAKMSDFVWYQVIAYDETWPKDKGFVGLEKTSA